MSTATSPKTPGPLEQKIVEKLQQTFKPTYFTIANDSHKHSHHAAMKGAENTVESHFRVLLVSENFEGKSLPMRHRMVYSTLTEEMNHVHALQMKTKTPAEYEVAKDK